MKREILFKAKRVDGRGWVFGNLVVEMKGVSILSFNSVKYTVFPETVCQFTGLLDKNGIKIFEGDILQTPQGLTPISFEAELFEVSHARGYIGGGFDFCDCFDLSEAEITGNIHDKNLKR